MDIKKLGLLSLLLVLLVVPAAAQKKAQPKSQKVERIQLQELVIERWEEFEVNDTLAHISGPRVHIFSKDGKMDVEARDVKIFFSPGEGGKSVLKNAVFTGNVKMLWKSEPVKFPTQYTKIASNKADVDWIMRKAVLTDSVLIETTDPMMFGQLGTVSPESPVTITTDKATVSFLSEEKRKKTGEPRIRIEGNSERNKIKFTPMIPDKESESDSSAHQD